MKQTTILCLLLLWLMPNAEAQKPADFNVTEVGQLNYTQQLNDVWGYVDTAGNEYALVGTRTGTSIVSLADPANPVEVLFIPGSISTWRDLKTWGHYAYVTTDQGSANDGLLIIDLSPLPLGTPTYHFWKPTLVVNNDTATLNTAHNLYIDENGYCYIAGSNISNGENFILDVHTNPDTPIYMGATLPIYAHDAYTRGDTLWTSDIYVGDFSAYDVSDKNNPTFLASQTTPRNFAHNTWISDDGNTLFTTDEKNEAWIGAYDVSDLGNIRELDRWRTPTPSTIPHNVHVLEDYLVISYYTDGLIVLDGSDPTNMVEVARYDSYGNLQPSTGFHGAWGAYPFLPSGRVLVSDMNTGLHVLQVNYQRGCRLEGNVTDNSNSAPIFDANLQLLTTNESENTDLFGAYKMGIGVAGNYDLKVEKTGYIPKTVPVSLSNGQTNTVNVTLDPAVPFQFSGRVVRDDNNSTGVANAQVRLKSSMYDYTVTTDANGDFVANILPDDDYTIIAGKWGKQPNQQLNINATDSTNLPTVIIPIKDGYYDDFSLNLDWNIAGNATAGAWERGVPKQLFNNAQPILPAGDIPSDFGDDCYVTGNNGNGNFGSDNLDGQTILESPVFDLTSFSAPQLNYYYYHIQPWPADTNITLKIEVMNGIDTVALSEEVLSYNWSTQQNFMLNDFITPTANMKVRFIATDTVGSAIESALDVVEIIDTANVTTSKIYQPSPKGMVWLSPNPFSQQVQLRYDLPADSKGEAHQLQVYNALGQMIEERQLAEDQGILSLGENWNNGLYFVILDGQVTKLIKRR